ncbi:hypothetical protein D9758_002743 [Tetrapyrgos nigripes]|uniref:Uncharacterized protein n=1 Tax=Tetrapyrgos nigripes TaxID=182062 RepID=A0A8H5GQF0_9AGAR|nr:hypothetical protein D9758_002743 [Tetrapyrgos nigripes]
MSLYGSLAQGSLVPRVPTRDMMQHHGNEALPLLYLWTYLNLVSNTILLPILVATFIFSKRAKRHPTLINVCITWIFSGVYSLLLFYAGVSKPSDPEPDRALCVAQTSLMYGITPMWSVAILVLMYHLNFVASGNADKVVGRTKLIIMLTSPYIVEFGFSLATLVISLTNGPGLVKRSHGFFYCALFAHPLFVAMSIFTFIMCLGINALEIQLAMLLYRRWRGLRHAGLHLHFDTQLTLRVFLFGVYIFFGMAANVVKLFDDHSLLPDLYVATIGTVILLVFGVTQPDVLRVWCFWRKDNPSSESPSPRPCPSSLQTSSTSMLYPSEYPTPTGEYHRALDFFPQKSASTLDLDSTRQPVPAPAPVPLSLNVNANLDPTRVLAQPPKARSHDKVRGPRSNVSTDIKGYQRV